MSSTLQGRPAYWPEWSGRCGNLEGHHPVQRNVSLRHFGCSRFEGVRVLDCVADFKVQAKTSKAGTRNGAARIAMPLIPNIALFQRKLGGFPIATYQAGETVIAGASTSGRLLILRTGAVAVLRDGVEIATVREPGAVFGELSVLLDQPHSADVRALEVSRFHVADAATLLRVDPIALLYVATVLARRLDDANQALIELRRQLEAGRPRSMIEKTAEGIEGLLGASGTNMTFARYPYDLFAPGAANR
jgi:CRP/FNR family cyclic AMP-dependent transcriptional regulator